MMEGQLSELPYGIMNKSEVVKNIIDGKNVQDIALDLITSSGDINSIEFSALVKGKALFWFARNSSVLA